MADTFEILSDGTERTTTTTIDGTKTIITVVDKKEVTNDGKTETIVTETVTIKEKEKPDVVTVDTLKTLTVKENGEDVTLAATRTKTDAAGNKDISILTSPGGPESKAKYDADKNLETLSTTDSSVVDSRKGEADLIICAEKIMSVRAATVNEVYIGLKADIVILGASFSSVVGLSFDLGANARARFEATWGFSHLAVSVPVGTTWMDKATAAAFANVQHVTSATSKFDTAAANAETTMTRLETAAQKTYLGATLETQSTAVTEDVAAKERTAVAALTEAVDELDEVIGNANRTMVTATSVSQKSVQTAATLTQLHTARTRTAATRKSGGGISTVTGKVVNGPK